MQGRRAARTDRRRDGAEPRARSVVLCFFFFFFPCTHAFRRLDVVHSRPLWFFFSFFIVVPLALPLCFFSSLLPFCCSASRAHTAPSSPASLSLSLSRARARARLCNGGWRCSLVFFVRRPDLSSPRVEMSCALGGRAEKETKGRSEAERAASDEHQARGRRTRTGRATDYHQLGRSTKQYARRCDIPTLAHAIALFTQWLPCTSTQPNKRKKKFLWPISSPALYFSVTQTT